MLNIIADAMLLASRFGHSLDQGVDARGVEVGKSEVVMGEGPLRHIGEFQVLIHLHADVEVPVKVIVEAEAG